VRLRGPLDPTFCNPSQQKQFSFITKARALVPSVAVEALCICSACPPFRPKLIAFGHDGYQSELACIACFVLIRPIEQAITFLELSLCASSCASTFDMALIHGIGRTSQHDEVPYTMLRSILSRDLFQLHYVFCECLDGKRQTASTRCTLSIPARGRFQRPLRGTIDFQSTIGNSLSEFQGQSLVCIQYVKCQTYFRIR